MSPETSDQDSSHPTDRSSRAVSREERDRIILSNPVLSLAFSTANATLISLYQPDTQTELIDPTEASAEGFLWRLQLTTQDGSLLTLTSRHSAEFAHSLGYQRRCRDLRLSLQWRDFRLGPTLIEAQVTAQILLSPDTSFALFELELQLPERLSVRSVAFPCICALGFPDPLTEEALFLPLSGGALIHNPRSALHSPQKTSCQAVYPGPASVQMLGYSCGNHTTAWLASRDPSGARKTMTASAMAHSSRLALWISHHPTSRDNHLWRLDHPVALGLVRGDWFEAARDYRAWALEQPWCTAGNRRERALPTLTSSYGLWLSHWGAPRASLAAARELQRIINIPIKLDWRCWHSCARDGAYPDYFPPREGDQVFALAKQHLSEAGVLTQLTFSGLNVSPQSKTSIADEAHRYTLLPSQQSDSSPGPDSFPSPLTPMCPSTRYWREKLVALTQQALQHGAEGLYLEDLTASEPLLCQNPDHEHGPPTPSQWAGGIRATLRAVRAAVGETMHLAADGPVEPYLDLLDAFFSPHPAAEREGLFPQQLAHHCAPIPLFSSVYHDYSTLIGPPLFLLNFRPHDPLWPAAAVADLRLPSYLMERDFEPQFCLEVARATSWGHHLLLADFSTDQAHHESTHRRIAFLAAALRAQAWGVGALLPYAEFMGPLQIDSPTLDIDFLINPPHATPADRRSLHLTIHPILGSAWRTPGGGLALVLVNAHHQLLEFAACLPSSRLSPQLPLHLVGRTFSEDGDVPAASLRASGTEISGRLPGRCVLLVTLR